MKKHFHLSHAGVCASSVLDNCKVYGPHHLLLPGSKFFQSRQEESPWLEVSLEKQAFLSGLLLLCPENAPPVEASVIAQDHSQSGGSQLEAFKSYTAVHCSILPSDIFEGKIVGQSSGGRRQTIIFPVGISCSGVRLTLRKTGKQESLRIQQIVFF